MPWFNLSEAALSALSDLLDVNDEDDYLVESGLSPEGLQELRDAVATLNRRATVPADPHLQMVKLAEDYGRERGYAAAEWVFDGNSVDATYQRAFDMLEEGDPEFWTAYGPADGWLSGEWADTETPATLLAKVGYVSTGDYWEEDAEPILLAYEDGANAAFEGGVYAACMAHLHP